MIRPSEAVIANGIGTGDTHGYDGDNTERQKQISGGAWARTAWPSRSKQNPFTEHFMHRMTGFAALLASVLVAAAPLAVAGPQQAKPPADAPGNAAGNPAPPHPKEAPAAFP